MSDKKKILFRGPALTQSGYGVHARQIVRWLLQKQDIDLNIQVLPWGDTPWMLDATMCDGLIGDILSRTGDISGQADVTFQLQLPHEWRTDLGKYNVGITAGVETDKCNDEWRIACNQMSRIVVPSKHTKNTLSTADNTGSTPVVIPEAFCDAVMTSQPESLQLPDLVTKFNFLMFGQLTSTNPDTDRKNSFNALRWMCDKFSDDPDVGIIFKTNSGRNTRIDRLYVKNMLTQFLSAVRKGAYPRIYLLHGDMTDEEVVAIYRHRSVKALIAPTRGEGFGLPILEAAACGLPVIATAWSGHTDFLSAGKYIELSYDLKPVPQSRVDDKIFMSGARWAEVIEEDFKKRVVKFRESPQIPRAWADDLETKLVTTHNFSAIAAKYDAEFGHVF